MGRAYEVRKASIQKTGAMKAKLYSTFAKEIYNCISNIPNYISNYIFNIYKIIYPICISNIIIPPNPWDWLKHWLTIINVRKDGEQ